MKKLLFAAALALAAVTTAKADFAWNWWVGSPAENSSKDIQGCQLGLACDAASIQGAQVSICWNKTGFLPFFVFFNFDPNCFGGN